MITKAAAYKDSSGRLHDTLDSARAADLEQLFKDLEQVAGQATVVAQRVLDNQQRILDILTTTRRSRPGRQVVNGFRGKRQRGGASHAVAAGPDGAAGAVNKPSAQAV